MAQRNIVLRENLANEHPTNRPTDAYRRSISTSLGTIAQDLQHLLTPRITAYIVGVRDAKTISRWANGDVTQVRDANVERKLRITYEISRMLLDYDESDIVKAWFVSMNPCLADRTPAEVIRQGQEREALDAARSFVVKG
jgi:hypothetical protein